MPRPALIRYFDRRDRLLPSTLGRLLLRHREEERIEILRRWLPEEETLSILDVGCGDGSCLAAALVVPPRFIQLEDISATALTAAANRLSCEGREVACFAGDGFRFDVPAARYDVTLAIGVLDYQTDTRSGLDRLLRRTSGMLIANVPRSGHPRNWIRRLWFFARGLPFRGLTRGRLRRILTDIEHPFEIEAGPYEWFLKVTLAGQPHRTDATGAAGAVGTICGTAEAAAAARTKG